MDSHDDLRSELQRAGEVFLELIRPDLQKLRLGIVADITTELRRASRTGVRYSMDRRKQEIAELIQENPTIFNLQICYEMDKRHVPPLRSWKCKSWAEAYRCVRNRVHAYISSIRKR